MTILNELTYEHLCKPVITGCFEKTCMETCVVPSANCPVVGMLSYHGKMLFGLPSQLSLESRSDMVNISDESLTCTYRMFGRGTDIIVLED